MAQRAHVHGRVNDLALAGQWKRSELRGSLPGTRTWICSSTPLIHTIMSVMVWEMRSLDRRYIQWPPRSRDRQSPKDKCIGPDSVYVHALNEDKFHRGRTWLAMQAAMAPLQHPSFSERRSACWQYRRHRPLQKVMMLGRQQKKFHFMDIHCPRTAACTPLRSVSAVESLVNVGKAPVGACVRRAENKSIF